jgi:hypothetical protein
MMHPISWRKGRIFKPGSLKNRLKGQNSGRERPYLYVPLLKPSQSLSSFREGGSGWDTGISGYNSILYEALSCSMKSKVLTRQCS